MNQDQELQDVQVREAQLQQHIIRSEEYSARIEREMKRQVLVLYLSIVILLALQGLFIFKASFSALWPYVLMATCSVLAVINCFLLMQTRGWLQRINEAWLKPSEKIALDSIRIKKQELARRVALTDVESPGEA